MPLHSSSSSSSSLFGANHFLKKKSQNSSKHHHNFLYLIFITINIIILTSHVSAQKTTHFNFLRGRKRVAWCANDPTLCSDPDKNPWGGPTCCFQRYCKDTLNDPNHCGSCGRACGFGFGCCGGSCVDTRNDPLHCGACFEECPRGTRCAYSMCDYGG